jgi:regulator of protease activity HflC (stomatin/prohibitin superfamily)
MDEGMKSIIKLVAGGFAALFALIVGLGSFYTIGQYEAGVLTRFGKVVGTSDPGLHFKVPFIYGVEKYRTDLLSLSTPEKSKGASIYTVDNQEVHVVFTVQYRIPLDRAAYVYENAQDYQTRLYQIAEDRLKAELGKVNTSHVSENRGKIRDGVKTVLAEAVKNLGVQIIDFQLNNIEYDDSFKNAVKAAANARATVETREQERQQAIKVAEKRKVEAEGEANAAREKARGDADAVLLAAQAEAKSIKLKADAMIAAGPAFLDLRRVDVEQTKASAWDGKLPVWITPGAAQYMPIEAPARK